MREIKFRAWDPYNKKWLNPAQFSIRFDTGQIQMNGTAGIIGGCVLMQYTGLKDKNGKEIYEGDIVKHNENIFQVKWSDNLLSWCVLRKLNKKEISWRDGDWLVRCSKYIEIIGNIHETPELLGN